MITEKDRAKIEQIINPPGLAPLSNSGFYLTWFTIRYTSLMSEKERYVIFGEGKWIYHVMDWRGCNFWQKKLSPHPFDSVEEAKNWLREAVSAELLWERMMIRGGSFLNDSGSDKEVETVYFAEFGQEAKSNG